MAGGRGRASRIARQQAQTTRGQGASLEARTRQQPRGRHGALDRQAGGPAYHQPRGRGWNQGGRGGRGQSRGGYGEGSGGHGGRGWSRGGRGGRDQSRGGYGGRGQSRDGRGGSRGGYRGRGQDRGGRGQSRGGRGQGREDQRDPRLMAAWKTPTGGVQAASAGTPAGPQDPIWAAVKALQSTIESMAQQLGLPVAGRLAATGAERPAAQTRAQDKGPAPTSREQTGPGTRRDQAGRATGENNVQPSSNADFAKVCKAAYRYVQLSHHEGNWLALPQGIAVGLHRVTDSIRPPMPSEEL
jgi:hypothetical protein